MSLKSDLVFDGATVFHPALHAAVSDSGCDGDAAAGFLARPRVTREAFWAAARERGIAKEQDGGDEPRVRPRGRRHVAGGHAAAPGPRSEARESRLQWIRRDRARGLRGGAPSRPALEDAASHRAQADAGRGAAHHVLQPSLG